MTTNEIIAALNEAKSSDHYTVNARADEFHLTDGEHEVFVGYDYDGIDELVDRLPMCERALDNWQE